MMNFNFKNIKDHPVSTLVGLIVLVACFVLPHFMDFNFTDTIQVIIIVLTFLFYGDNGKNGGTALIVCLILAGMASCNRSKDREKVQFDKQTIDSLLRVCDSLNRKQINLKKEYEKYTDLHLPSLDELDSTSTN